MNNLRVYVIETPAANGQWYVMGVEKTHRYACDAMREFRKRYSDAKFRVRRYVPDETRAAVNVGV